jgi:hypothetical protein
VTGASDVAVEDLDVSVYSIPTDQPEADGTMAWTTTTMVAVRARAADTVGFGWTYASAAAADVVREILAAVVRGRDALGWTATVFLESRSRSASPGAPGRAATWPGRGWPGTRSGTPSSCTSTRTVDTPSDRRCGWAVRSTTSA